MRKDAYNECPGCGGMKRNVSRQCGACARGGLPMGGCAEAAREYGVSPDTVRLLGGPSRLRKLEPCFRDVLLKAMRPGKSKDIILALRRRGMPASNSTQRCDSRFDPEKVLRKRKAA